MLDKYHKESVKQLLADLQNKLSKFDNTKAADREKMQQIIRRLR